jgi:protein-tyrosine phosphatase
MIDIHNHILAEIDDGPTSWDESLVMAKKSYESGIRHLIATPHISLTSPEYPVEIIGEKVCNFQEILRQNNIDITVYPGVELDMEIEILDYCREKLVEYCLNPGGMRKENFILIHFSLSSIPHFLKSLVFGIAGKGIIPVLAHPERNMELSGNLEIIKELLNMGALIQVNSGSILGTYSRSVQKNAEYLLKNNLVHFIASDAHSSNFKPLKDALKRAGKFIKNPEDFVSKNPLKIIGVDK